MSLSGKKALITGARRNIGRGIALALAQEGCDIGINDIERDADAEETLRLIRETGREAEFFQADISHPGQVEAMFNAFHESFGRIDCLVNNAAGGLAGDSNVFWEISETAWDTLLNICLKGYFLCSQHAARAMTEQGEGGAIVSISSVHASRAWPQDTCYGVAKAGILRLTQSMAVDLGPYGIRCNAILPGHMNVHHLFDTPPPALGSIEEDLHHFVPLRRRGIPEDIGRAVAFLCSPASGCITGVSIPVDGGMLATGVNVNR